MKKNFKKIVLISVCCGIGISLAFVNPYKESIDLSELIFQISGSSGEFCLGTSLPELVSFMLRMIPNYIIMMILGNNVYQYFCTASIYIFSRCPNRHLWYRKIIINLFVQVIVYEIIFTASVVLVTAMRFNVENSAFGVFLLVYHILVYAMWNFAWALFVNVLAIKKASSTAFMVATGSQLFLTSCLNLANVMEMNHLDGQLIEKIIILNPVAHTILGWHEYITYKGYHSIGLLSSVVLMLTFCLTMILAGDLIIRKQDLLMENTETGVM